MNDLKTQRVLEDYPSRASTDIRFADLDRQGHVNNAVFATFSEVGRVAFMYDPERPLVSEGRSFVIARLLIDFRAELFWPGTVDIGTGVVRVGRSSFTLAQGLFNDGRREVRLRPGDTVIFPAGEIHQVTSLTRMVLYRVQAGPDRKPKMAETWPS